MAFAKIAGLEASTGKWRPLICNSDGKLIIDPSEILEDTPTDGEMGKAPTSNWAHDHCSDPDVHTALNRLEVRTGLAVGTVFSGLSQISRDWGDMAAAPNGDVYASVYNGDIYVRSGGTGDFTALGQTSRNYRGMAVAPNGDVYACVYGGDIYVRSGGTGDFAALGQTGRNWIGMCAAPNGDVYASVYNGDIYVREGGAGDFTPLSQTSRSWVGMCAAPNGDVYAGVYGGDIYVRSGGTGDFVALGQTGRHWRGMAAASNGDVYAGVYGGDIYVRSGGEGDFVALGQEFRYWRGMAVTPDGDVYVCVSNGDIYISTSYITPDALLRCSGNIRGKMLKADDGTSGTVVCGGKSLTSSYGIVSAISNAYSTLTTGTYTDTSVSGKGLLILDTSGGNITIKGLSGGTARQMIWCVKTSRFGAVTLVNESSEAAEGDRLWTVSGGDETLRADYIGGFWLTYSGTRWIVERIINV